MSSRALANRRFRRVVLLPLRRRLAPLARVRSHGFDVLVDTRDGVIGRNLYLGDGWEEAVISILPRLGLEGKVAVDVGANLGIHTLELSRATGPHGRVLAFEPESRSLSLLRRNVATNDAANVTIYPVALGDRRGRARLARSATNLGDHRVLLEGGTTTEEIEEVAVDRLDEYCRNLAPDSVGVIKIDVQGYEAEVLRGAAETLDANPDAWIILEVPSLRSRQLTPGSELVSSLVERGFRGFELHPGRIIPLLEPSAYSMIYQDDINLLLTRNEARFEAAMEETRARMQRSVERQTRRT